MASINTQVPTDLAQTDLTSELNQSNPSSEAKTPRRIARVKVLAEDDGAEGSSAASKDERILERIRKCFDRGRHPTTPEAEAKSSLMMAAKLMSQHNFTEAEALAKDNKSANCRLKPGESIVEVIHITGKKLSVPMFVVLLADAIKTFFECDYFYDVQIHPVQIVFVGIGKNTAAAAMAFEMCYNLIMNWGLAKEGRAQKQAYYVGVATGLLDLATLEKERAEQEEKKEQQQKGQSQIMLYDADAIAEEYLRSKYPDVVQASMHGLAISDMGAYEEGIEDSKQISVRGKRLRSGEFKDTT